MWCQRRLPMRPAAITMLLLGQALVAGCGADAPPAEAPRTVLVARPVDDAQHAVSAFAGDVRAREESPLAFRVGGNLARRDVDIGARVSRGDVLAVLDPGDLRLQAQSAQAQAAAADGELVRARADQQRFAALARDQLVSRSALDGQTAALQAAEGQARAAQAQLDVARNQAGYAELRAPRDGVIASREVEAGQVVAAGQTVMTIAVDGPREVAIALPESQLGNVAVGQPVAVELWNAPGRRIAGRIRELSPAADPQARTYAARVSLTGDGADAVALGQSARVYLQQANAAGALSVPLSALQRGADGAAAVWVVDADTVRRVPVTVGTLGEARVVVTRGLSPTDWVVTAGGHLLRDGQPVTPVDRDNRPLRGGRRVPPAAATAPAR